MIADLDTLLTALFVELTDRIIPLREPGRRGAAGATWSRQITRPDASAALLRLSVFLPGYVVEA
jgi:hypothetical protein